MLCRRLRRRSQLVVATQGRAASGMPMHASTTRWVCQCVLRAHTHTHPHTFPGACVARVDARSVVCVCCVPAGGSLHTRSPLPLPKSCPISLPHLPAMHAAQGVGAPSQSIYGALPPRLRPQQQQQQQQQQLRPNLLAVSSQQVCVVEGRRKCSHYVAALAVARARTAGHTRC
jgi:hypothetical protein